MTTNKRHLQSCLVPKNIAETYTGLKFKQQETHIIRELEYSNEVLWFKNLIRLTADINKKIWKQSKVTIIVDDYLLNLFKQISSFSKDGSHDEHFLEIAFKKEKSKNDKRKFLKLVSHQITINNKLFITIFDPFEMRECSVDKVITKQSIKKDSYYPSLIELYQINQLLNKE